LHVVDEASEDLVFQEEEVDVALQQDGDWGVRCWEGLKACEGKRV
jgi:hypothetical protein